MLNIKLLLTGIICWIVMAVPSFACPAPAGDSTGFEDLTTTEGSTAYSRREGNRCEGLMNRDSVSGALELISFATAQQEQLGNSLLIRVPGNGEPDSVVVQAQAYRLDGFEMTPSRRYGNIFNLSTRTLRSARLTINDLRGIARNDSGSIRYRPVIFGEGASNGYRFVFYSSRRVQFLDAKILNAKGEAIAHWGEQTPMLNGEKAFGWTSAVNQPAGQYTFEYVAEIAQRNREPERIVRRIPLLHSPDWLRE
jgi:hypothetical protein